MPLPGYGRYQMRTTQITGQPNDDTLLIGSNPNRVCIRISNASTAKVANCEAREIVTPAWRMHVPIQGDNQCTYREHGPLVGAAWWHAFNGFAMSLYIYELIYLG